jgi:acetyl esterase/lipase
MHRNAMDYLVRDLDCPVLFVEYGLVPESTQATAATQCYAAYLHLLSLGLFANPLFLSSHSQAWSPIVSRCWVIRPVVA